MRGLEAALQPFGEVILKARLTGAKAAPYIVGWVRGFLTRPATDEPLADQVRRFREDLERAGACHDWPVRQAARPSASTSSTSSAGPTGIGAPHTA